jgi:hypothetical protein
VHACWDARLIDKVAASNEGSNLINEDLLIQASHRAQWQFEALETLLTGKEMRLPDGASFRDKDDHLRHNIRVRWWDQSATNYSDAFLGPESARTHIPDDEIRGDHLVEYSHATPPVFIGHYWMEGHPSPPANGYPVRCTFVKTGHGPPAALEPACFAVLGNQSGELLTGVTADLHQVANHHLFSLT